MNKLTQKVQMLALATPVFAQDIKFSAGNDFEELEKLTAGGIVSGINITTFNTINNLR